MVRFTDSNVVVDDYPPRQRDNQSRNGRWSPDYHYAGGAAPPSPGPIPDPARPVVTRENSLQIPHWDRYRPRSVPPPMSPTTEATSMVFPPPRSRSRNHDRDRESSYHGRDRDRHEDRTSRPKTDREAKGRHRDRYYDSGSSSSSDDERKGNKPTIGRSRTPMSKARQAISSTFSDSTTGLATGVIGAVLGGLAAREASEKVLTNKGGHGRDGHGHHHSGKEALLSTIAGAAVGALGANVIEKRIESSRKKSSATSPTSASHANGGKGSDDGRNYTWGGDERRRSSVIEEKKDRNHGRRDGRDDMETYRDRDIRRDRSQRRGGSREEHRDRYYSSDDDDDEVVYDYKRRSTRDRSRARRDDEDRRDRR
ncbi:hypothetical protein V8F33_000647 [Rhypophila sp. PSN 637]